MHRLSKTRRLEPIHWPHGESIYELVGPRSAGTKIHSLFRVEIKPGASSRPHYHPISEESFYVLEGRGRVELDGDLGTIEPGDTILVRPGQHHQIWTLGDETLVMILTCVPAWHLSDMVYLDE
ncbi:MAG: cupin domain-containing protein [Puniceicoccales bacterium]